MPSSGKYILLIFVAFTFILPKENILSLLFSESSSFFSPLSIFFTCLPVGKVSDFFIVFVFAIVTSLIDLSFLTFRKIGCLSIPSLVTSVNFISQTNLGLTQVTCILVFTFSSNGDLLCFSGCSKLHISFNDC